MQLDPIAPCLYCILGVVPEMCSPPCTLILQMPLKLQNGLCVFGIQLCHIPAGYQDASLLGYHIGTKADP